jgi:tetratricopeptide (TPR) repeat protein
MNPSSQTRSWKGLTAFAAAALFLATGCGAREKRTPQTEADTIRREATPARLEASGDKATLAGDMSRAEQYYMAALSMGGDERQLVRKVVAVCASDGRYPVAVKYATDFLAKHPEDTDMRFAAGALEAAAGDSVAARLAYERVVVEKPDLAEAHFALAMLLREQNAANSEATNHLRLYLALEPHGRYAEAARAALVRRQP